jgi:5-(carboxyamino)imidazole ribonucleotide mutase
MNSDDQQPANPRVAVIMGSVSDWETMKAAVEMLETFGVATERRVVSAHRTPELMAQWANRAAGRGLQVVIAGAGGAAHLPGMVAAHTHLPVLGVPVESRVLRGVDSLLSIVQMPAGIPVGTLAIGTAGAKNAALLAISILALHDENLRESLVAFREKQSEDVRAAELPA